MIINLYNSHVNFFCNWNRQRESAKTLSMTMDRDSIFIEPRHYDLLAQMTAPDDVPFYLKKAEEYGGPVLELACGTGRVCIPLAQKGFEVSGLDRSLPMLTQARAKAELAGVNLELILADCRDFRLDKKFNLILFPYNSINLLHDLESVRACFSVVALHLAESGRFIMETFNPDLEFLGRDTSQPIHVVRYLDPDRSEEVVMTETSEYDYATQINHVVWHYEIGGQKEAMVHEMDMRIFFPQEFDALLGFSGFEIEHKYGNYDQSPFSSKSPKQIVVCRDRE